MSNRYSLTVLLFAAILGAFAPKAQAGFPAPRLANLALDSGSGGTGFASATLSPSFNSEVFEYNLTIPFEHDEIQVNGATVTVDTFLHNVVYELPPSIPANFTTQFIVSAAEDFPGGAQTDYTVNIYRGTPNSNANLSKLSTSQFSLTPTFNQAVFNYSGTVEENVTSLLVNATTQDPGASITINGSAVASGIASQPINLSVGYNQVSVVVTSADESVIRTYLIDVTRQGGIPDSDMDGIPDTYESINGLTVGINDAMLDLDGDGLCNICEYAFGSDPDDFGDHNDPLITRSAGGFLQISFTRAIDPAQGLSYQVEVSSDLSASWSSDVTDLTNPATPQAQIWRDSFGGSPTPPATRFIRIRFVSSL